MPLIAPTCASCGSPATMSPMAKMPGSAVSCASFTLISPRSSSMRVFSTPMPPVRPARPTATSTFSASFTCGLPFASVKVTLTPASVCSTLSTFAPVFTSMPRFLKSRVSSLEISSSSTGTMRGRNSRIVTSAPKVRKMRGELHAHRARADDDQRFGELLQGQNLDVGQNAVVRRKAGQHLGLGAGGQNHVLRLHLAEYRSPLVTSTVCTPSCAGPVSRAIALECAQSCASSSGSPGLWCAWR